MMIRQFASGLVLSVLTISIACAPRIDNLAVAPGSQDQDLTASADIKPFMSGVGTPSTSVDDLSTPDAIFSPAGTMARTTGNHYEGTIPGLPYGAYQLRVKVPYTLVLQLRFVCYSARAGKVARGGVTPWMRLPVG